MFPSARIYHYRVINKSNHTNKKWYEHFQYFEVGFQKKIVNSLQINYNATIIIEHALQLYKNKKIYKLEKFN